MAILRDGNMTITTESILKDAKALVANPDNWVKSKVKVTEENGRCRFCVLGALAEIHALNVLPWGAGHEARSLLYKALLRPGQTVASYNDSPATTHDDIMALFDRAIALCK